MPTVACPQCSTPLSVPENATGRKVRCPQCQTIFAAGIAQPATAPTAGSPPARGGGTRRRTRLDRTPSSSSSGVWIGAAIGVGLLIAAGAYMAGSKERAPAAIVKRLSEDPTLRAYITNGGDASAQHVLVQDRHDTVMVPTTFGFPVGTSVRVINSVELNGVMYIQVEGGTTMGWIPERCLELRRPQ